MSGYDGITDRMSSFTPHLYNPATPTPIVLYNYSWNTRMNAPGSAIMRFNCFVTVFGKAFPCFKGLNSMAS